MDHSGFIILLTELADGLEFLKGESEKSKFYRNMALNLTPQKSDLAAAVQDQRFSEIKKLFEEYVKTSHVFEFEKLKKAITKDVFKMMKLSCLNPKSTREIFNQLDITSLVELEYACREDRLSKIEGFVVKIKKQILY